MKKIFVMLVLLGVFCFPCNLFAQDTWGAIKSYNPETDPQVNFPQKVIDEVTGNTPRGSDANTAKGGSTAKVEKPTVEPATQGTMQARLVKSAAEHYKKYAKPGSFPYLPETGNGNKGCAQVVNSIFEGAGIPIFKNVKSGSEDYYNRIRAVATYKKLLEMGWKEVTPPPYKAGDVITWNTTGKPDSHIGIIMATGNNVMAISNSSKYKRPRFNPAGPEYAPMTRLLRKPS